jgi:hypothetical protein
MDILSAGRNKVMSVASALFLSVAIATLAWALWDFAHPAFTDDQIRTNIVDTWEAHSLGSTVIEAAETMAILVCVTAIFFSRQRSRWRFAFAALIFLISLCVAIIDSNRLTHRAENLKGLNLVRLRPATAFSAF